MRPQILFPLFAPVVSLQGVGPRLAELIEKAAGPHVLDLCLTLPTSVVDRSRRATTMSAPLGEISTLEVIVDVHQKSPRRRGPYRVRCRDDEGFVSLVFFHANEQWITSTLPQGERRLISGRMEEFNGVRQMVHPDYILPVARAADLPAFERVYPLTAGLSPKVMGKAVAHAVERAPPLPEWQDPEWLRRNEWSGWREALAAAQAPQSTKDLASTSPARSRFAYDELLANQLALALVRRNRKASRGTAIDGDGALRARVLQSLPFQLTGAQTRALEVIYADMASTDRMIRLLHGDVGSGKTAVALLAMAGAAEAGFQSAMMAPTALLAQQHCETLRQLSGGALVVEELTGADKGRGRAQKLAALTAGEIDVVIGTHALFQDDVAFNALGLVVIDEQHRFGVRQRLSLMQKGKGANMLVMTATPIPRTLALTMYGDMDVTKLDEKPPGRKEIATRALPIERLNDVVERIGAALRSGAQAYWICPLVEETETSQLMAVETRYEYLKEMFGDKVGVVHGQLPEAEKDAVMATFKSGETSLLVATTVVEVGVDAPNASIIVIEHAERFGLAQLHQLRGRVGRGEQASTCLLLYDGPLGETAKARLSIMRQTNDGFLIAEEDLRLRGAGDVLGAQQSGLPRFRLADVAAHGKLLEAARDDASLIVVRDAELATERGRALRVLLYLFERDEALRLLRSG